MIKRHEFNTRWWGRPVGIVTDPELFEISLTEREKLLSQYSWVEFRSPLEELSVTLSDINQAGFFQVDTQINYRLGFRKLMKPSSLNELRVEFADENSFTVRDEEVKSFDHERFFRLPGISSEKANQRYTLWSKEHMERHARNSLRILHQGQVQGWYFGDDSVGAGLNLTLGMLSRDATVSGLLVFLKAYHAFAGKGHRMGWASFSVNNTPVHNIYAAVGAHFINPIGYWLWVRD